MSAATLEKLEEEATLLPLPEKERLIDSLLKSIQYSSSQVEKSGRTRKPVHYPYITSHSGIAGGVPILEGTRITVRCIAGYYQLGMDVDEILFSLSHLTTSQVHAALAYYFDHQEEIERDLEESSDVEYWKTQVLTSPGH